MWRTTEKISDIDIALSKSWFKTDCSVWGFSIVSNGSIAVKCFPDVQCREIWGVSDGDDPGMVQAWGGLRVALAGYTSTCQRAHSADQ